MFKISVFITVRFIGKDFHEQILSEYLNLSESHKNATYLSQNSVSLFITEISNWMKDETIKKTKEHENYTFLIRENLEITNRRFSGMDGCSTMAGIYHGVRSSF